MKWTNVRLVLGREVRDQLRDRRTMFMIFVLPVLLYPFLGMSFFQVAQFVRENPSKVLLIGLDRLPSEPLLLEPAGDEPRLFQPSLFRDAATQPLLEVLVDPELESLANEAEELAAAERLVKEGKYEVAVCMPRDFQARLAELRTRLRERPAADAGEKDPGSADLRPVLYHHGAKEKSELALARVLDVMRRWGDRIGRDNLALVGVDERAVYPFETKPQDVAEAGRRDAAMWSRLFPFMLLIWALTGAFYPAIDLCAGEKERGTLETLLSSPALRSEIVWGKLLTVMTFSMVTVLLNLVSVVVTGFLILSQIENIGPPPLGAFLWLLAALVPVSALFSALCLALAAFARSTKEGQYYLMPLFLVALPLVLAPMSPGTELNLGNSLVPLTGIVLVLRSLIEGEWLHTLPYLPPVITVTGACCVLAIRWAVDQFNTESVLFRESERFSLSLWLRHLRRDRGDTPSVAEAVSCGVLILMVKFGMELVLSRMQGQLALEQRSIDFLAQAAVTQLVVVLTPALLMTVMLTRSPWKSLSLRLPPLGSIPAAILLAAALHPLVMGLHRVVMRIYPMDPRMAKQLEGLLGDVPVWQALLAVSLLAPLCEELAFRGFVLSGLRHLGHRWRAIVISSVFFALSHGILQQSLLAFPVGLVVGYLVVQSGSLLPAIAFHATHNAMQFIVAEALERNLLPGWVAKATADAKGYDFSPVALGVSAAAALLILLWFRRLSYARTPEEALQEEIERQSAQGAASAS